MRSLENFVLLCGIQTTLLSILLLIVVLMVRTVLRRRTTALVVSGLASLAALWVVAFVPMSGWMSAYLERSGQSDQLNLIEAEIASEFGNPGAPNTESDVRENQIASSPTVFSQLVKATIEELRRSDLESESGAVVAPIWTWKKWFSALISIAVALGLLRLLVAYLTIWRLQSKSFVVTSSKLFEQLDVICAQLNCRQTISVYETDTTTAAFTLGWWRPKIVLSAAWRNWSDDELQATLAHEVAHVNSGDFFQRMIAQIAAALNFYNPIVHYLCNLLCIDQEFNADYHASSIVGGRKNYLNTLATMALENDLSNQRLAPMFLPTRKTFFRRIEMLRSKEADRTESRMGRWTGIVLAVALMVVVAGVRYDEAQAVASDSTAAESNTLQSTAANLRFVPNNAHLIMVARLGALLKNGSMKKLNQALVPVGADSNQMDRYCEDVFAVELKDIDQLTVHYSNDDESAAMGMVIQLSKDGWWAGDDASVNFKEKLIANRHSTFRGKPIYLCEKTAWQAMYYTPDDRTMVVAAPANNAFATELTLKSSIRAAKGPQSNASVDKWNEIAASRFSLIARDQFLDLTNAAIDAREDMWSPLVKPLAENAQQIVAAMDIDRDKIDIDAWVFCDTGDDGESIKQVSDSASLLVNLARTMLRGVKDNPGQRVDAQAFVKVTELGVSLLDNIEIKKAQDHISLSTSIKSPGEDMLIPMIPALAAINQASARVDAANEMRNLMLALLNYEAAHGRFPPAVLTSKNDKKYSWRVAILPYLGRSDLYEQYRFEEDWDSEHNLELARAIPNEFQHPVSETIGSDFCSYFLVTGKGTGFDGEIGMRITDLSDGTSNTLCIVEAKKEAYWTQPVDVVYADNQLDTPLGGFSSGGFNGSFFDGSTHFLSEKIDPATLRLLFLSNDGGVMNWNDLDRRN